MEELEHGNDVAHIIGAANHEAARGEYVATAKRSRFFSFLGPQIERWATADLDMRALFRSGLFRTVSDHALVASWGHWAPPSDRNNPARYRPDVQGT